MAISPEVPRHVIPIDHTEGLLAALRDDPLAVASCSFHEGFLADVIYAAPEGAHFDPNARIVALCGQHIIKGSDVKLIPLVDQTLGYWSKRMGYEPLLQRENIPRARKVQRLLSKLH